MSTPRRPSRRSSASAAAAAAALASSAPRAAPAALAAVAAIAAVGAPAPAAAQTAVAVAVAADDAAPAPAPRRVEGRAGMLLGGSDVGDADGFSVGITTGLGYRIDDVTLRARFDHYRTGDGKDEALGRRGRGTRVGGAVRYSFANVKDPRERAGLGADFWGEVGAGLEHVTWRRGGVLDRPSAELAIGFELDAYGRRDARGRRRHIGYFLAFRTFLAQGPEMEGPAVCGGPCTKATRPSRLDTSMFFELGVHWGR